MHFLVQPSVVKDAVVTVPGDKSVSHRALMLGSIADGTTEVAGFLAGDDCLATLAAMRAMGVPIEHPSATRLRIQGVGLSGLQTPSEVLDLGNSGTAMRLMAGLLCGQTFDSVLTGDDSLRGRPMQRVIEPLRRMGAVIESLGGRPPLRISGQRALGAIDYELPVASAQVKSAVLLAGLYANGVTCVSEPAVTRDHTERMLQTMGVKVDSSGGRICMPGSQRLTGCPIQVPADLSSAAFLVLAAILSDHAEVLIEGVGVNPTRTGVLDILTAMGADIALENPRRYGAEPVADIRVRSSQLVGCEVDPRLVSLAIDEFPILFVAAAAARGVTKYAGIGELRVKESDRIAAMAAGLRALGIRVDESDDGAVVHGGRMTAGRVSSHGDHRVAMSFAIAATVANGDVLIEDVEAVATSFPGFGDRLAELGVSIFEVDDRDGAASQDTVPVLAIDGPSGSGKGTIARRVAEALNWHLLDSGALYRVVALAARRRGVALDDATALAQVATDLDVRFDVATSGEERIVLDGDDVTAEIRTEAAGAGASQVAALPAVRDALLERQRAFRRRPGLVADGRDMGTQVFPDATLKVFLTASPAERAIRRYKQLKGKGIDVSLAALSRDIEERDRRDSERSIAPLTAAKDARVLDSTGLSIDAATQTVLDWIAELHASSERLFMDRT